MNKLRKHIIIAFTGVFLFPIVFQSVHIILHHIHLHEHEHELSCCPPEFNFSGNHQIKQYQKDEHCLICEYKISLKSFPKFPVFEMLLPEVNMLFSVTYASQPNKTVFSYKSSRAPPV